MQNIIEEVYPVLNDDGLRKDYNQTHPQIANGQEWEMPPSDKSRLREVKDIAQEKEGSLSFTDLSMHFEEGVYHGERLRQIRERMGVDLKALSAETKISSKNLEWIEEEAVERLPAPVYLKGFLKAYAQALGLDPQKVVEGYLQSVNILKKR